MAKKKKSSKFLFKAGDMVVVDKGFGHPHIFDICEQNGDIYENQECSKVIANYSVHNENKYVVEIDSHWGHEEIYFEEKLLKVDLDKEILNVLLKQAEFQAQQDADVVEKFMVSSLSHSVEMREDSITVGCQTLNVKDAVYIADKLKERYS